MMRSTEMFSFMQTISESKLIPSLKTLHEYDQEDLAELTYLHILTLRILLAENIDDIQHFAQRYCRKTAEHGNFKKWYTNSTDVYVMLYGLISDDAKNDRSDHHPHMFMPIEPFMMFRFFQAAGNRALHDDLIHRVFVKLDTWFRIKDSSLRAIRRLVMDWETITVAQKRLALTRLLQYMRNRAPRGELLPWLNKVGVLRDLELDHVANPETGELKEANFLLALETASAGATGAASVATVVGGLGAGFDADYSRSVYPPPKSEKKKKVALVRR